MPMRKSKHIYEYPQYYEVGFCQTNIRRVIDFIVRCYQKHQKNSALSSIIDNGCGTGHYLEEFAKIGIEVCGYDSSPQMVKYASARLARITARFHVFRADLRDFTKRHKYDMAICMNGSFQYLMTVEDIVCHLKCVANALEDGGLYLISLPAPEDFFLNPPGSIKSEWSDTRDGITVAVNWTYRQDPIEWSTQTFSGLAKIEVNDNGHELSLEMPYQYRIFFPQEISTLVYLSGCFEIIHIYGNFHLGKTYGKMRQARFMNVLLRKARSR
jgi:SAM-dependent methyltransferase